MIVCMNCEKLETYKIREIITRELQYSEGGWIRSAKVVSEKEGERRCPK